MRDEWVVELEGVGRDRGSRYGNLVDPGGGSCVDAWDGCLTQPSISPRSKVRRGSMVGSQ